jgi:uncharacterized membrane protein
MLLKIKDYFTHEDRKIRDNRWIFFSMLIGAICSLIAAFVLSNEAVELARNPNAVLSCSINVILNCAKVGLHPSAHIFGFPNSFLGMIAEPVVITVAIAGLAGVKFPRAFMFVAQIFYTAGLVFAYWLFSQSFFVIGALCPWCLLVTATTTFVWFAITRYNVRENNLYLAKQASEWAHKIIERDYDKVVLFSIIVLMVVTIIAKYGTALFA